MTRLPTLLLFILAGCGGWQFPTGTAGGLPGTVWGTDAGSSLGDGGTTDAGMICTGDNDGASGGARVVVSELPVGSSPFVELRNNTVSTVEVSSLSFAGTVTPTFTATSIAADGFVLGTIPSSSAGELQIAQAGTPVFYMCWGSQSPTDLQNAAVIAGLWTTPGVCSVLPPNSADSLHLTSSGRSFGDWAAGAPTPLGCAAP